MGTFGIEIIALRLQAVQVVRLDSQLEEQVVDVREVVMAQALARADRPVGCLLRSPHAAAASTASGPDTTSDPRHNKDAQKCWRMDVACNGNEAFLRHS